MACKKKTIQGNGWIIVREALDSATIHISNSTCLTDRAYHTAITSIANVKNIRIVLTYCD